MASLFTDAEHLADAEAFFTPRAAQLPGGPRNLAHVLERIRLNIALKEAQRNAEAEATYRRAIELRPDYATAYYNLALLLNEQSRPAHAEAMVRKAIALRPDDACAYDVLGRALGAPELDHCSNLFLGDEGRVQAMHPG